MSHHAPVSQQSTRRRVMLGGTAAAALRQLREEHKPTPVPPPVVIHPPTPDQHDDTPLHSCNSSSLSGTGCFLGVVLSKFPCWFCDVHIAARPKHHHHYHTTIITPPLSPQMIHLSLLLLHLSLPPTLHHPIIHPKANHQLKAQQQQCNVKPCSMYYHSCHHSGVYHSDRGDPMHLHAAGMRAHPMKMSVGVALRWVGSTLQLQACMLL